MDTARKNAMKYVKQNYGLYLCMVPGILFLLVFHYAPMAGLVIAFKNYNIFKGIWASSWAGFKYFFDLFKLPNFYSVVRNTLVLNVLNLLLKFPAPILMALLLNELRWSRFKRTAQSLLYIPHFMSWIVLAGIIVNLLSPEFGFVNQILRSFGAEPVFFMADPGWWIVVYTTSSVWQSVGWGTIVYMAALTAIDQELYEAAVVDGANRFQQVMRITIPCLLPTIVIMLILDLGRIMSIGFEQPMSLYNPIVSDVAEVISTYSYYMGIQQGKFSLVTALGFLQSIINLGMIVGANALAKKVGSDGLY